MYNTLRALGGKDINRILKADEERDAALAWQKNGDEKARLLIMQSHVKLVAREVRRLKGYRANPEDLLSEGMLGLTIAINKFDPDAGFRFSTYAIHWVRATMNAQILLSEGTARLPSTSKLKKIFYSYRRAALDISRRSRNAGENLSYERIQELTAEALGATVEDLRLVSGSMAAMMSIDQPISIGEDGSETTIMNLFPDTAPLPEETLNHTQVQRHIKEHVADAIASLRPREQEIILRRKLAESDEVTTLEELSGVYNVSRERIRQIEVNSLAKLKKALEPTRKILEFA